MASDVVYMVTNASDSNTLIKHNTHMNHQDSPDYVFRATFHNTASLSKHTNFHFLKKIRDES